MKELAEIRSTYVRAKIAMESAFSLYREGEFAASEVGLKYSRKLFDHATDLVRTLDQKLDELSSSIVRKAD